MPRRANDIFSSIANFEALRKAARKAIRGKRKKRGGAAFQFELERELLSLETELLSGAYRTGRYVEIELVRPKRRLVSAAPMRDRVVQHALIDIVGPIFENGFIGNTFANRKGKGTHRAISTYERYRNRYGHVLRCDIFRYFPSIDHEHLKSDFRRRIMCGRTLGLMDTIIDGSNLQEPVHIHFPGDDLLSPVERRRGLPIGNLMSQFCANLYLDPLDHYCAEVLQAPYLRYVDDFALFHDDPGQLETWLDRIASFIERRRLKLHPRKTRIQASCQPAEFLGLVLYPGGKRALPETNIDALKGRLRGMVAAVRAGTLERQEMDKYIASWEAHADHAHAYAARRAILGRARRRLRTGT